METHLHTTFHRWARAHTISETPRNRRIFFFNKSQIKYTEPLELIYNRAPVRVSTNSHYIAQIFAQLLLPKIKFFERKCFYSHVIEMVVVPRRSF